MLGAPGTGDGHRVDLFAMLLCLAVAWLLNRGIKTSAKVETYLVFVKLAIVLAVIVVGAFYIKSDNLTPYFPFGLSGAATGAATGGARIWCDGGWDDGHEATSSGRAARMARTDRSMSACVVDQLLTEIRIAVLSCHVVGPA